MSDPVSDAAKERERTFPLVTAIVALALGALAIGSAWIPGRSSEAEAPPQAEVVQSGALYYVFVETAEFAPMNPKGEAWDLDDSAPDIGYRLVWKGQSVFESSEVGDALIGRWSGMKIGLNEALSLLKQGKADPGQIVDAGLLRAELGGRFVISLYDSDLTGDEAAGEFTVPFDGLAIGTTTLVGPSADSGVLTLTLRVIPSQGDLFKTLRLLSSDTP